MKKKTETVTEKNSFLLKRLMNAGKGLFGAWRRESSFRTQSICALGLLIFCLILQPSPLWCAIFILAVTSVLGLELVNTAVETILDKLHPERDPEIGFAKDCLAGAVLIASLGSVILFVLFLISTFIL